MSGLIDVHNHLLPGVDDGCKTAEESIECARALVNNGYTHAFCTPHVWPNLPGNSVKKIPQYVDALQGAFDSAGVNLKLMPGGEINAHPKLMETPTEEIVSYGMAGKFVLVDLWADRLPEYFFDAASWLQDLGMTMILAHPERMRAIQNEPEVANELQERGVLLQGNLQCLSDPPGKDTRYVIERYLEENRYFMLGSDLHGTGGLAVRMAGLQRAKEILSAEKLRELMVENPGKLLTR